MNEATADELPSIEDVLDSRLPNITSFVANSCRYIGRTNDPMVNWVYTLFLKATSAASKDYNSNWWEGMSWTFDEK